MDRRQENASSKISIPDKYVFVNGAVHHLASSLDRMPFFWEEYRPCSKMSHASISMFLRAIPFCSRTYRIGRRRIDMKKRLFDKLVSAGTMFGTQAAPGLSAERTF
jgi:hypothetical protein